MRPSDWLIAFLAAEPATALDPVRVQKGLFLLAMEAPLATDERYAYEPYAYGPMSRGLYGDVRRLGDEGLLEAIPIEGAAWRLVTLTPTGTELARRVLEQAGAQYPEALARLHAIRCRISGLSFAELLQDVYERYPEYAVRSVFRRPR